MLRSLVNRSSIPVLHGQLLYFHILSALARTTPLNSHPCAKPPGGPPPPPIPKTELGSLQIPTFLLQATARFLGDFHAPSQFLRIHTPVRLAHRVLAVRKSPRRRNHRPRRHPDRRHLCRSAQKSAHLYQGRQNRKSHPCPSPTSNRHRCHRPFQRHGPSRPHRLPYAHLSLG